MKKMKTHTLILFIFVPDTAEIRISVFCVMSILSTTVICEQLQRGCKIVFRVICLSLPQTKMDKFIKTSKELKLYNAIADIFCRTSHPPTHQHNHRQNKDTSS